jgi:hypothetical protein
MNLEVVFDTKPQSITEHRAMVAFDHEKLEVVRDACEHASGVAHVIRVHDRAVATSFLAGGGAPA